MTGDSTMEQNADLSQMRIRTANINVNGSETHTAAFTVNVSQTS
jgi:hypothetical protein